MNEKNLKHTCNELEMVSILKGSVRIPNLFTIWKRNPEGKIIFQTRATLLSVNDFREATFALNEADSENSQGETFIASDGGNIIYRLGEIKLRKKVILANLPYEMKYQDRRLTPRTKLKRNDQKSFELTYTRNLFFNGDNERVVVSKLLDFSDGGACLYLSKQTLSDIDVSKEMYIKSLSPEVEVSTSKAMLMNARKHKGMTMGHDEMFAVGVMYV